MALQKFKLPQMLQRPERYFLEPKYIHRKLYCPLCSKVFYNPVVLPCKHSFCYQCISIWRQSQPWCPKCKDKPKIFMTSVNDVARSIIDDQKTKCGHPSCGWIGKLKYRRRHRKHCPFGVQTPKTQVPTNCLIDLEQDQPNHIFLKKQANSQEVLNQKIFKSYFPFIENFHKPHSYWNDHFFGPRLPKDFLHDQQQFFQQCQEFSSNNYNGGSNNTWMSDSGNLEKGLGISNSISLERGPTVTGSSSGTKTKSQNQILENADASVKQQRKFINPGKRILRNYKQDSEPYYKRINFLFPNYQPQNPGTGMRTRSRSRERQKDHDHLKSEIKPKNSRKSSKGLYNQQQDSFEEWQP